MVPDAVLDHDSLDLQGFKSEQDLDMVIMDSTGDHANVVKNHRISLDVVEVRTVSGLRCCTRDHEYRCEEEDQMDCSLDASRWRTTTWGPASWTGIGGRWRPANQGRGWPWYVE